MSTYKTIHAVQHIHDIFEDKINVNSNYQTSV